MKTPKLDELDRKLVALLQEDAHLTNREIAQRLGSSEPTIRRRVDRLLEQGVFKIVAVASPFSLGYGVIAILGLQIDRTQQAQIEETLRALPELRFIGLTLGSFDVMVEAWFRSNDDLLAFMSDKLSRIDGIRRVESWQVLKLAKYSYDWGEQPSVIP